MKHTEGRRENISGLEIMHFLGRRVHEFLPQGLFTNDSFNKNSRQRNKLHLIISTDIYQ